MVDQSYVPPKVWTSNAPNGGAICQWSIACPAKQLRERHAASDFETKTQDKLAAAST
jgi:hypothetical protein